MTRRTAADGHHSVKFWMRKLQYAV